MIPVAKRRILLIDDQASIHEDYRKIICPHTPGDEKLCEAEAQLFGEVDLAEYSRDLYDVDSALSGEDAIMLVAKALQEGRPYAVAFVDIRMPPGLDGVQTIRKIWEIDSEILAVLCSAYSDYSWDDLARDLRRADRFLILRKPFESSEVRQCAAALAERWVVARTDPLTRLLNRRSFEEHFRREWADAIRYERPLSCVMIDIDFFKSINDHYGHIVGDEALGLVADVISQQMRAGDVLCRYGGEEFCALLPCADGAAAVSWAERVRQAISESPLNVGSAQIPITASFGVAERNGSQSDEFIKNADQALRDAKGRGRNRVVLSQLFGAGQSDDHPMRKYAVLFQSLTARDVMVAPVTCLNRDTAVADAANLLLSRHISSAPVVNADGTLAGIVAERDIMEALGFSGGWHAPVEQCMVSRVIQYGPDTPAAEIFQFLCRVQIHRVVISQNGRPIGLISRGTFLRWVQNYVSALARSYSDENARPRLLETADALTHQAHRLRDDLHAADDELLAPIVSGVSSMQDIMADLLSWARFSQTHPSVVSSQPPLLHVNP
jgi:two-component system cell cycle response regulator